MKSFIPNNLDVSFKRWSNHGLVYLHQLFSCNNFKTFEQLRNGYGLPRTDFFQYLQLRTFLTTQKEWEKLNELTPVENFLVKMQTENGEKKIISEMYHTFSSMNLHNSFQIKQRWEAEMNMVISRDAWEEVCTEAHLVTN